MNMAYLNLYILTFNCARNLIDANLFASHLFDALPESQPSELPEVLVLSLQEIAPLSYSFLGGHFLESYYDAFRRAVELAVSDRGKDMHYVNTVAKNVGMTGIMVFVRQDVVGKVAGVETAETGVGFQEMGNKGAVGARLKYLVQEEERETVDLTFVAAHLAPMEDQVERRNQDWESIARRLVFSGSDATSTPREDAIDREDVPLLEGEDSSSHPTGMFTPTSHLFFAGDLNYRTSGTGPGENGHKAFPQPTSDRNSKMHYTYLLKDDQLSKEIHARRTLHGLSEAPIDFPPTYKYADGAHLIGSGNDATEWKWAQHRWPSWCDRILYLDAPSWVSNFGAVKPSVYDGLPLFPSSDHRAVALSVSVPLKPIPAPGLLSEMNDVSDSDIRLSPPFDLDMDWKYKRSVARSKEIIVGILAYLGLTWQGNGLILASGFGVFGGWLVLRAYLVG
ncbi:hypothetical protein FQN54_007647 [Arachnomyces sp. PD_36]|nr:hypothetical protein FQN54_007647 [Arachnomyces sp. PD_36]